MSSELELFIKSSIRQNGPMSIETYWNLCLSHPLYGYYVTHDPFGAAGDFITAPEISQLFGEMVGIWAAEQWTRMGKPKRVYLVEIGPGRGTLMSDLLRIAAIVPDFLSAVSLHLVETSGLLRRIQKEKLADYEIEWHDSIETLPQDAPVILIGNEFLDALAIRQFVANGGEWFERLVGLTSQGDLVLGLDLMPTLSPIPIGKDGSIYELSLARERFVQQLSQILNHKGGAALLVDYGHESSGFGDTLQAVKKHTYWNFLKECGEADITSHVDFGKLRKIALDQNITVKMSSQGEFLKKTGIEQRAERLQRNADEHQKEMIQSGLHRLTAPKEMGGLFRVMEMMK